MRMISINNTFLDLNEFNSVLGLLKLKFPGRKNKSINVSCSTYEKLMLRSAVVILLLHLFKTLLKHFHISLRKYLSFKFAEW